MREIAVPTHKPEEFINITPLIEKELRKNNYQNGLVFIFAPHTTAALTINENADPDVPFDIINGLKRMVPETGHHHAEGNSPAHIKSSLVGCSVTVALENGCLCLGMWQSVFLCEFDGPRQRKIWVTVYP